MARARLAGAIFNAAKKLPGQTSRLLGLDKMSTADKLWRFGPDVGFGVLAGVQTPGDLGDKIIAGTADAALSSGLGLAAGRPFGSGMVGNMADMAGSTAGAYAAMPVSESVMRAKDSLTGGQGLSPWEKQGLEYDAALRAQVIAELDAAGMLNPQIRTLLVNDNTGVV